MFLQHYLENIKLCFLSCITKEVYDAILESSKNKDLFGTAKPPFRHIFGIPLAWFL